MNEIGEHSTDSLTLPSLDAKFYICGKEFEVRDAMLLSTMTVEQVVNEFPDRWSSIEGVREYALGFFNGVVRDTR